MLRHQRVQHTPMLADEAKQLEADGVVLRVREVVDGAEIARASSRALGDGAQGVEQFLWPREQSVSDDAAKAEWQ